MLLRESTYAGVQNCHAIFCKFTDGGSEIDSAPTQSVFLRIATQGAKLIDRMWSNDFLHILTIDLASQIWAEIFWLLGKSGDISSVFILSLPVLTKQTYL